MFQEGGGGYTALGRYENSKEKRKITQIKRGHGFKNIFRNLSRLDSKAGWISKNAEEVALPPSDHQRAQLELAGGPSRKPAGYSLPLLQDSVVVDPSCTDSSSVGIQGEREATNSRQHCFIPYLSPVLF